MLLLLLLPLRSSFFLAIEVYIEIPTQVLRRCFYEPRAWRWRNDNETSAREQFCCTRMISQFLAVEGAIV